MSQLLCSDVFHRPKSRFAVLWRQAESPLPARIRESDQFERFNVCFAVDEMTLRHIANQGIATLGLGVEYLDIATERLLQPEDQAKESSLACTVRADNRYKLAAFNSETSLSPDSDIRVAYC